MKHRDFDIKTSYLAKAGKLPNAVSIAKGQPKWLPEIKTYQVLAPSWKLVNRESYSYEQYYEEVLKRLDPLKVAEHLDGKILLCWEKDPTHCHRRYVARWLQENLGIEVPEL